MLARAMTPSSLDDHALSCFREAGRIAAACREWARENIRAGVEVRHVLETIEDMIRERGAAPAFPAQSSRNSIAAHYCSPPGDDLCYEEDDCAKVDIGVHVDGYVADTAATVDLSTDGRWKKLIGAAADALTAAIAAVDDGVAVGILGTAIEGAIVAAGYNPVRNLTGHGVGRWKVHTPPQIPNQSERGGTPLEAGMVFAIEPFACDGRGYITERGRAEVFMMVGPPRRAKGLDRDILRDIESWRGLPIARRYFTHHDPELIEETFSKLARQGALMRFPPLVEEQGVTVAQAEHSVYLSADGVEILTA